MKLGVILAAIAGLGLVAYLIAYIGFDAVLSAIVSVGWGGFAVYCALGLANFVLLGIAWFVLVPGLKLDDIPTFLWGRLMRDSSAEILPFSQVGGFVLGARAIVLRGVPATEATASTIVDVTTELIAQLMFIAMGLVILTTQAPDSPFKTALITAVCIGLGLVSAGAVVFLVTQRHGLDVLERMIARFLPKALTQTAAVSQALNEMHRSVFRLSLSVAIHLAGWLTSAAATWVVLRVIGAPVGFEAAIAIDSLLCAVRSAAFVVPSAVGVQELTYAMLVPLFGLAPSVGLAVSLIKRGRDILIGAPVLVLWQVMEGRRQLAKSKPLQPGASDKEEIPMSGTRASTE